MSKQSVALDKKKQKYPEVDTLLHIVKGAVVKVLYSVDPNCAVTVSTTCQKPTQGKLAVAWKAFPNVPDRKMLDQIENAANEIIEKDIPVKVIPMDKKEAEEKFKEGVNHTKIYDKFPVPESVTTVNVLLIDDWNVNCCSGAHLASTGKVRRIQIERTNERPQKSELEFAFKVVEATSSTPSKKSASSTVQNKNAPRSRVPGPNDDLVKFFREDIFETFMEELAAQKLELTPTQKEKLKEAVGPKVDVSLNLLRNRCYTNGLFAVPKKN